jgi:hypothetical protein
MFVNGNVCVCVQVRPYWIPDNDATTCMLCSRQFTLVRRRHHCRSCGRVLCTDCCAQHAVLAYLGTIDTTPILVNHRLAATTKPARVCAPCAGTLERIAHHEAEEKLRAAAVVPSSNIADQPSSQFHNLRRRSPPPPYTETPGVGQQVDDASTSMATARVTGICALSSCWLDAYR